MRHHNLRHKGVGIGLIRPSLLPVAFCLLPLLLAACDALPALAPGYERRQQTLDEGVTITLDSPGEPIVEETQRLRITLTDQRGRPIDGADVYVDLDMEMLCLSGAAPAAEPIGAGQYEALAVYLMPGDWDVAVIARIDGVDRRAVFSITVSE